METESEKEKRKKRNTTTDKLTSVAWSVRNRRRSLGKIYEGGGSKEKKLGESVMKIRGKSMENIKSKGGAGRGYFLPVEKVVGSLGDLVVEF